MMKITIIQADLAWEDPGKNLETFSAELSRLEEPGGLVLLPELFSTGFSMRSKELAEGMDGYALRWMAEQAALYSITLAGSLIISEEGSFYNRLIWMPPDGHFACYDKRHLFRIYGEEKNYSPGNQHLVTSLEGMRFRPLICYDLRFPVWSRNRNDYDVLLYLANWPSPRRDVWNTLLKARALENQAYVIGVNRVGTDGMGIEYEGESQVIDAKGRQLAYLEPGYTGSLTIELSIDELIAFREKFPVWKDADPFSLD